MIQIGSTRIVVDWIGQNVPENIDWDGLKQNVEETRENLLQPTPEWEKSLL